MTNRWLSKYIGNTKKHVILSVFARWLRLLCNIGFAFIFAYLLNELLKGDTRGVGSWGLIAIGLIFIIIVKLAVSRWVAAENSKVVDEVKLNLRKRIYKKILEYGPGYINEISTAKAIQIGVESVEQLETYYGGYITQLYYSFVAAITLFIAIAVYDVGVGIVILVISPVIPLLLTFLLRVVRKVQSKYWKSYSDVGTLFLDSLQGLTTLKLYSADEDRAEEMDVKAEKFRKDTMRVLKMQLNSINIVDILCYGGAAASVILALKAADSGSLGIFGCILVIILSAEFFVPMRQLTALFHVAMGGVTAGEQIIEFLERKPDIPQGKEDFPKGADIDIRELDFSYDDKKKVLDKISLRVKNKGLVAFVGVSGCGKSTLASILSGQLSAGDNMVFYGDTDINRIDRTKLVGAVTRVTHNGHIFKGTVRSNLDMGKPGASDEDMIKALDEVNLWEFLSEMNGLETPVNSGATNLSGGQAQRLCLARALLHDSSVYIFDEAASNVDVESEEIILSAISKIAERKTVIYISHRLKSIMGADNIYVFDGGKIVEQGTHSKLIAESGIYKKLFSEQEELESFRDLSAKGAWKI